jgi:hypothetical protein
MNDNFTPFLTDYSIKEHQLNNNIQPKTFYVLYVNEHGLLKYEPIVHPKGQYERIYMGVVFDECAFILGVYRNGTMLNSINANAQFTPKELYFMNPKEEQQPLTFFPELLTEQDYRPRGSVLILPYIA